MQGALLILAFTIIVGILLYIFDRKGRGKNITEPSPDNDLKIDGQDETEGLRTANVESGIINSTVDDSVEADNEDSEECCGMHVICEKTSLSPVSPEIEYFDDEELDRFRGRTADSYSDVEIDEFLDVLLTMQPSEVASWSRSLQLRSVVPPVAVRDQILLIVAEQRVKA